jgi:hypothetical protein
MREQQHISVLEQRENVLTVYHIFDLLSDPQLYDLGEIKQQIQTAIPDDYTSVEQLFELQRSAFVEALQSLFIPFDQQSVSDYQLTLLKHMRSELENSIKIAYTAHITLSYPDTEATKDALPDSVISFSAPDDTTHYQLIAELNTKSLDTTTYATILHALILELRILYFNLVSVINQHESIGPRIQRKKNMILYSMEEILMKYRTEQFFLMSSKTL